MTTKPSIPKGTRDFSPQEMAKRNYIFNTIREVYELYGFRQIETPAMENLSTLMGKYGEEGDKLLFKILNSGDFMRGVQREDIDAGNPGHLAALLCEKGLALRPYGALLHVLWCSTATSCSCLSSVTRFNPCGVPTARRKAVTASFTSATPDRGLAPTRSSTRWNWCRLSIPFLHVSA